MPVYGYRLFVVQVFAGKGRTSVPFADCGGRNYRDIATELLEDMQGKTLVQPKRPDLPVDDDVAGEADLRTPAHPLAGRKALAVRVVHQERDLIYGEVLVGTFGDHEAALAAPPELIEVPPEEDVTAGSGGDGELSTDSSAEATDIDLTGRAPARRYRFVFNIPDEGALGALVVEDISRACPVELIIAWLRRRAEEAAEGRLAELPESATSQVQTRASTWWRPMATAAVDDMHFNEMLDAGRLNRVELVRHSVSADGSRQAEDLRLTAPRPEALTPVSDLVQLAKDWYEVVKERRSGALPAPQGRVSAEERKTAKADARARRQQTDEEAAKAMAALLGDHFVGLGFDDGWLVLEDGGRTKRISPSRISELFVYEIDRNRRPSNLEFYEAGRRRAQRLANPLKLNLNWPSTIGVEETEGA